MYFGAKRRGSEEGRRSIPRHLNVRLNGNRPKEKGKKSLENVKMLNITAKVRHIKPKLHSLGNYSRLNSGNTHNSIQNLLSPT